jgi:hypothetical protein
VLIPGALGAILVAQGNEGKNPAISMGESRKNRDFTRKPQGRSVQAKKPHGRSVRAKRKENHNGRPLVFIAKYFVIHSIYAATP